MQETISEIPARIRGKELDNLILSLLAEAEKSQDYRLSLRDLVVATGAGSTSVINYHLDKLQIRGLITRAPMLARTIRLTEAGRKQCDTNTIQAKS